MNDEGAEAARKAALELLVHVSDWLAILIGAVDSSMGLVAFGEFVKEADQTLYI